ncbi:hypothetical protein OUZ56_002044 [Daphnia magna]|uniref:Uncharacterized protein n=1 Tax=Daphnia magna TaxID=35525 RepID=A0ABR0A4Z9_9CRUS|nr:hypothetical protein OUZ56_002044 [Daphnia magna]
MGVGSNLELVVACSPSSAAPFGCCKLPGFTCVPLLIVALNISVQTALMNDVISVFLIRLLDVSLS